MRQIKLLIKQALMKSLPSSAEPSELLLMFTLQLSPTNFPNEHGPGLVLEKILLKF